MKIHGRSTFGRHVTATIRLGVKQDAGAEPEFETVSARLRILSVDFGERIGNILPAPKPPMVPRMGDNGVVRGKDGRPELFPDENDRAYLTAKARNDVLGAIAFFDAALDDPDWQFETKRPESDSPVDAWRAYYEALYDEMKRNDFPQMAFGDIAECSKWIAGIDRKSIEEVKRSF